MFVVVLLLARNCYQRIPTLAVASSKIFAVVLGALVVLVAAAEAGTVAVAVTVVTARVVHGHHTVLLLCHFLISIEVVVS